MLLVRELYYESANSCTDTMYVCVVFLFKGWYCNICVKYNVHVIVHLHVGSFQPGLYYS